MNDQDIFDPLNYYSSYPLKVIGSPGYPARAVYKSTLLFNSFSQYIFGEIGTINTYADIGGCFGFGANAMAYHIAKHQGSIPKTMVFELSPGFLDIGKILFAHIDFVDADFTKWEGNVKIFDLVTLFDVVEHIVDPQPFLQALATRSKYVMLKTPMETPGEWRPSKPPIGYGDSHPDGHVNFFTPKAYEKLLEDSGLEIVKSRLIESIIPFNAHSVLQPEGADEYTGSKQSKSTSVKNFLRQMLLLVVPFSLARKVLSGGDHISLCRSRLL
jgi:hypothetical protein